MILLPDGRSAGFVTESGQQEPAELTLIGDETRADDALRLLRRGKALLWAGDYRNGRQLLGALKRRLRATSKAPTAAGLLERWHLDREATRTAAELLGRIMIVLGPSGGLELRRAPDVREAIELAWGPGEEPRVVSFQALIGAMGAAEWTRKGMEIKGLTGRLTPRFGVFSPTRSSYLDLLDHLDVEGKTILDVGCGTGVLGFILLQRGATRAVGTDLDPRAVDCALKNAETLGLSGRFNAVEADLFPGDERADCVVFNAPWIPDSPRTRLDRAVFDEGGQTLCRFITGVREHLTENGVAALIVSDLPERLGMRTPGHITAMASDAGLKILSVHDTPATHGRAKEIKDPLHEARGAERIRMFVFA